jgi:hypothetical protein
MPLSKSLIQPFRKNKLMVGAGWRSFFAPYNAALGSAQASTVQGPTILDLTQGPFNTNSLPTGFFDLGWIKEFKLTPGSKIGQVRSGYRGAIRAQYKGEVGESFEFKFREYGRLQYKIASGSNVFNLLSGTTPSTVGPLSASGSLAVPVGTGAFYVVSGGTATLRVANGSGTQFGVGNYIVCDVDYSTTQFGIVGDAGVPVFQNAVTDVDYTRKNSDYVARVTAINGDVLTLDQPFAGGGSGNPTAFTQPQVGSKVQKIVGWAAREGGTMISEWTGLFILDTVDACQIAVYYPHISIAASRDPANAWAIENAGTTDETGYELDAQFNALAFDDPLDGETAVGYKCYYPRPLENPAY